MKNGLEVVQKLDISDMFVELQRVYSQDLGIKMGLDEENVLQPEMRYILSEPNKLPNQAHYHPNFILDVDYDLPRILIGYCEKIVRELNFEALIRLEHDIEKNRIRQSLFESDYASDLQSESVNQFITHLHAATLAHKNVLNLRQHSLSVQKVSDIVFSNQPAEMLKKLKDFYEKELGIRLYAQFSDEEEEDIQTVMGVGDGYQKLSQLGLSLPDKPNLDSEDLFMILEHYFKTHVSYLDLETLIKLGEQIKFWHDGFSYLVQRDFELASFLSHLQDIVKAQIQAHLSQIFQAPELTIRYLSLIVNHLELLTEKSEANDMQKFLDTVENEEERVALEKMPHPQLRNMIQEEEIKAYFQRIDRMPLQPSTDLLQACDLKTFLTLLDLKTANPNLGLQNTLTRLGPIIEEGLKELLLKYKMDVEATISDRNKTKKLTSIDAMLKTLEDPGMSSEEKVQDIKDLFDKAINIHKTESLGRYLYRCICSFLNKPCHINEYQMKLFKGMADEQSEDLDFKQRYKKLR